MSWPGNQSTPRVLVQGITGREARYWTERMVAYGTNVAAGVTPGKGGEAVQGIPVYETVAEARAKHEVDTSVLFVPARAVKGAALEAIRSHVQTIVVLTEHVPVQDTMEVLATASDAGARVFGPNCPGLVVPDSYFLGILPAWEETIFRRGRVGIASRSGSLGTLICVEMIRRGFGQSAFLGIGGDPIVGTTFIHALRGFEVDEETDAVVLVGEIGGSMEEDAAPVVAEMTIPVIAFIAGASAPEGRKMGHAGAIVAGDKGTARSKKTALREAGARVAEIPSQVGELLAKLDD